ncbi:MAG TPA: hypothetical protein DDZ81_14425 [Acetobacteraceae bacterium]|jgi:hypothetical protein|nr:hypothetical protein [Acetobacteraceae bacterium]
MFRWLRAYTHSDDPHVAACNTIAMVIAWNQPYYPLYLLWIVGRDAWVGIPDAFSGVLFFAVPAIARRFPLLGRIAMVVFSVANVVFCSMMLGEAAGVQLLYIPCGMLAAILFTWRERSVMLAMTALPLVAWYFTRTRLDIPPIRFTPEAYASLFTLNAVSAGALMVFFGWLLAGINRAVEERGR